MMCSWLYKCSLVCHGVVNYWKNGYTLRIVDELKIIIITYLSCKYGYDVLIEIRFNLHQPAFKSAAVEWWDVDVSQL